MAEMEKIDTATQFLDILHKAFRKTARGVLMKLNMTKYWSQ
jgi:hypothetical protein